MPYEEVTVGDRALVLLPGFLSTSAAYSALVAPLREAGYAVEVPALAPGRLALLTGRYTVEDEAVDAAALVRGLVESGQRVLLAGHSRGGQAAFLAAGLLATAGDQVDAVALIDPVDGEGRAPTAPTSTAGGAAAFSRRALVLGAALGGRCAPDPVNHTVFAAAIPQARHVVVRELGHTDMLGGRSRTFGRRLCGGAPDPDPGRAACTELLAALVDDDLGRVTGPLLDWRR